MQNFEKEWFMSLSKEAQDNYEKMELRPAPLSMAMGLSDEEKVKSGFNHLGTRKVTKWWDKNMKVWTEEEVKRGKKL